MKRICSYCGNTYGCRTKDKIKDCFSCDGLCADFTKLTHGICPKCFEIIMDEIKGGYYGTHNPKNGGSGNTGGNGH